MRKSRAVAIFLLILSTLLPIFVSCGECEHQWNEGYVAEAPSDQKAGQKIYTCILCGETKSEEIPKLTHVKHDFSKSQWGYDEKSHWLICDFDDCDATTVKGNHIYYNSAEGDFICTVCKSTSTAHSFTDKLSYDENCHWTLCDEQDCPAIFSKLPHKLDSLGKCTDCSFVAVHEAHAYTVWDITKDNHCLVCNFEGCGATTDKAAHVWIKESGVELCRDCRVKK